LIWRFKSFIEVKYLDQESCFGVGNIVEVYLFSILFKLKSTLSILAIDELKL
jgi:hypothetical protein